MRLRLRKDKGNIRQKKHRGVRSRVNAEGAYKIIGKQTLEPLNPGILVPFLPTK